MCIFTKAVLNVAKITDVYTIGGSSPHCTLTEKSGHYGQVGMPEFTFTPATNSDGVAEIEETTEGKLAGNIIKVTATSVYDTTKKGQSIITVA